MQALTRTPVAQLATRFLFSIGALFLAVAGAQAQTTWYVDASAGAPGNGTAQAPFQRIDHALAQTQVVTGDTILVAPGIYPPERIDFLGKGVLVESTGGSGQTILIGIYETSGAWDTEPLVRFVSGEGADSILRGFTIRGVEGIANSPAAPIVCVQSSPRLEDCVIANCLNGDAGALYVDGGDVVLRGCRFQDVDMAVKVTSGSLTAFDCWFGGCSGYAIKGDMTSLSMERCEFLNCGHPINNYLAAIFASQSTVEIVDSLFDAGAFGSNAWAPHLRMLDCVSTVQGSTFQRGCNSLCGETETGVSFFGGSLDVSTSLFRNNSGASGGAIRGRGAFTALGCTFRDNDGAYDVGNGGALELGGTVRLTRCGFFGNRASNGGAVALVENGTTALIQSCIFEQNRAQSWIYEQTPIVGGAVSAVGIQSLEIRDSQFLGNSCFGGSASGRILDAQGGAVFCDSFLSVSDSSFRSNRCESLGEASGGALYLPAGGQIGSTLLADNSVISSVDTHAAAIFGNASLVRSTLDNGLSPEPALLEGNLQGCIVVGTTPLTGSVTAMESMVTGGWPGSGNLMGRANFWAVGDYHLLPGSRAIDAVPSLGNSDPDGSIADMGAFPYSPDYCGPDCNGVLGVQHCAGNTNSTGQGSTAFALGSDSLAASDLVLGVRDLPPGTFGFFLTSTLTGSVPLLGGGLGDLCLRGRLRRLDDSILRANSAGQVGVRRSVQNIAPFTTLLSGDTVYFQYWYRDTVAGQSTSNTSSAFGVLFQD